MNGIIVLSITLAWLAILAGGWLGWQLLRQNGRVLLRVEELEKRLDELEFGGGEEREGLPLGSEAPAFELTDLVAQRHTLAQYRGQPLLLIFFNPDCGYCRDMMPKLAGIGLGSRRGDEANSPDPESGIRNQKSEDRLLTSAAMPEFPRVLLITTGDAEKNRQFFAKHKLGCPVLLQNDGDVAKAYQVNGTPAGYLVSADGKIASELAVGAETLVGLAKGKVADEKAKSGKQKIEIEQSASANGDSRAGRFANRSLARSKIKRDGLKAGTPAPDFRLPLLDGSGELALSELRGKSVLLVFSSPHCGPCSMLAPELEKFHRRCKQHRRPPSPRPSPLPLPSPPAPLPSDGRGWQGEGEALAAVEVVMISKGEPKENRAKVKEHGLTFPVVLQQQWEISRLYAMFATPIAYLIDEAGVISHDVAVGADAIREFMARTHPLPDGKL